MIEKSSFLKKKMAVALVAIASFSSIGVSNAVYAEGTLEEIIVTTQRKAESLQDVPIAVTALSEATLEKTDTHDLSGIAVQVPGLTFSPFSPGQNIVSLRGASSSDDGAGTDSSVAIFIDDVYFGRVSNINPELFDLERIEVLRGPQGTLYGKNTIGGAINVISTRPNTEEFEGKIRIGLGNYSSRDVAAYASGPIGDNWAAKVSLSSRERDGWADNKVLNKEQKDDNRFAIRGQLLYAGDDFEALLSADFNDLDVGDIGRIPEASNYNGNAGGANPAVYRAGYEAFCGSVTDPKCVAGPVDGFAKLEAYGVSAKFTWNLTESTDLISISSYRNSSADWLMDSSGSPAVDQNNMFILADGRRSSIAPRPDAVFPDSAGGLVLGDRIKDETDQFTQEFRLVSELRDNFDFVVGLWYLYEDTDRAECFDLNDASNASDCLVTTGTRSERNLANDGSDYYRQVNETNNFAAYGQFDWDIIEQLTLTVGARYSYEEKSIDNTALDGDFVIIDETFYNSVKNDWSGFTPKVALNYRPIDTLNLYASVATGFKSGGFPAAPTTIVDTNPLDEETVINYEVGFKADATDTFRINGALYYADYTDLQIQSFGPRPDAPVNDFGRFETFNAGDASLYGIELESTWLVTDQFSLSGFIAWQNSEFGKTDIINSRCCANQDGQDLIRTPDLKFAITGDYVVPLSDGSELDFNVNYNFTGDQRGELEPYAIQPEFGLLSARAAWVSSNDALEIAIWGKNLTDEDYINHIYTIANSVTSVYGDPLTYGVTGTFRF